MAITTQDVKLYKSERMDDTPDGGGRMTGNEVIDGELNNVFDDTSRLDRTLGRVSLRKAFGAVSTDNADRFLGVHAIVTDPPADGQVAVTILELNSHTDQRDDAKAYVENYLVASVSTPLTLYDNQPAGAQTIIGYVDVQDTYEPPPVGEVIVLSVEKSTDPNFGYQQFVRVSAISSYELVLNLGSSIVRKRVYTIEISAPLEITFPGTDIVENPTNATHRPTRVRETDLASGAKYYGVVPLAAEAEPGDSTIQVSTILQPVVPASFSEDPILDQPLGPERTAVVQAGPSYTEATAGLASNATGELSYQLPRAVTPQTLTLALTGAGTGNDATLVDVGMGELERSAGGANTTAALGTVINGTGLISITGLPASTSYSAAATYAPAAAIPDVGHTTGLLIDDNNRGFNYPFILIPKPAPGTVTMTYAALGRYYTLEDNGSGQLVGAPGTGAGTINYVTGTVNLTVGYEPDVGSSVLVGWRTKAHYLDITTTAGEIGAISLTVDHPIKPGSVEITWDVDEVTYTVTDDGAGGLTGDCVSGRAYYGNQGLQFIPTHYPAKLDDINVEYLRQVRRTHTPSPQPTPGDPNTTFTLPDAPIEPRSVSMTVAYQNDGDFMLMAITDDGAGVLNRKGAAIGTINYTTGEVVLVSDFVVESEDFIP